MKQYLAILIAVLILFYQNSRAQTTESQDRQLLFYNLGFGVVSSGIGAIINKPKHEKLGTCLRNGLLQGLVGGGLLYAAKRTDYLIYKKMEPMYAWPSHFLEAAGYSLIENAASGRKPFQSWNFELGPIRFDYNRAKKHAFRARLLPSSILSVVYAKDVGGTFDLNTSLRLGQIVFKHDGLINNGGSDAEGVSFGRSVVYADFYGTRYHGMGHELIHTYQFQELQVMNTYTNPITNKIRNKVLRAIFTDYIYADVPYFWEIYYWVGNSDNAHHFQNFYEFEAEHFSLNRPVLR